MPNTRLFFFVMISLCSFFINGCGSGQNPFRENPSGLECMTLNKSNLCYKIRNDLAFIADDLVLGTVSQVRKMRAQAEAKDKHMLSYEAPFTVANRWPDGIIPYAID